MRLPVIMAVLGFVFVATLGQSLAEERAGATVVSRIQPEQLAKVISEAGYKATVESAGDNGKYVATTMSGFNVWIVPYDCTNQGCSSIQFWAGFEAADDLTLEFANAWNTQKRFARANLQADGNFTFTADVVFIGGVSLDNIKATAALFDYLLVQLSKFKP